MHSLELTKLIFKREFSALLSSRTYFAFFVILCALTGFSFTQALSLYSEASLTGIQYPELARGLSPFDGVFVPTFGGLYLGMTLLFPLLAIQILSAERDSGSLLYLFQWPISRAQLIFAKVMAVLAVWILGALPIVVSILTWVALKGHFASGELFIVVLGYFLYAFALVGISVSAAAFSRTFGTAALLALAITIGSWVLDFMGQSSGSAMVRTLTSFSLTKALHAFEIGLFDFAPFAELALIGFGGIALGSIALQPSKPLKRIALESVTILLIGVAAICAAKTIRASRDFTEDRRNSFPLAVEQVLGQLHEPLEVTIYLSPDDSRFREFDRKIISKLSRIVRRFNWRFGEMQKTGLFQSPTDDRYGVFEYAYQGRQAESRSLSATEIIQTILDVTGNKSMTISTVKSEYPGYPWTHPVPSALAWVYIALAAVFSGAWLIFHFRARST